jgi:sialic acid synthase SpsE
VDKDAAAAQLRPLAGIFGKSVVARTQLPAGTILEERHLAFKKPGNGLPEEQAPLILNRKLRQPLCADALILEEHLE